MLVREESHLVRTFYFVKMSRARALHAQMEPLLSPNKVKGWTVPVETHVGMAGRLIRFRTVGK